MRADFVTETTTTTGLVAYELAGAAVGFQGFVTAGLDTEAVTYAVTDGIDFEVATGVVASGTPDTLSRASVLASSNAGGPVDWGAGTKTIKQVVSASELDSFLTSIADNSVTNAKLANVDTSTIKGRVTAATGDPEDLTATQVRSLINVADGANNYTHPNHSGDVTSAGDGAQTLTVAAITSKTELTAGLAATDEFLVNDGGVIKRMDASVLAELYLRTDNTGAKSVNGNPFIAQQTLTDGATITWTPTNGTEAFVTLGGNRTLVLNAVPPAGTWLTLLVRQDATGSRTLAYSSTYFNFGDAGTPVLTTAANAYDVLSFRSNGTRAQFIGIAQGFTA